MNGSRNVSGFELLPTRRERMPPKSGRIGASPSLFVTRAATLEYQELTHTQFETARRTLTERLLETADPDPERDDCFLFHLESPTFSGMVRAFTHRRGNLLLVPHIAPID